MNKSENVKRIRREMSESMQNRSRVDDDSDLEDIVLKRMAADKQEFVLMDWVDFGSKGDDQSQTKKTNRGGRPIHAQERQHGLRGHIDLD